MFITETSAGDTWWQRGQDDLWVSHNSRIIFFQGCKSEFGFRNVSKQSIKLQKINLSECSWTSPYAHKICLPDDVLCFQKPPEGSSFHVLACFPRRLLLSSCRHTFTPNYLRMTRKLTLVKVLQARDRTVFPFELLLQWSSCIILFCFHVAQDMRTECEDSLSRHLSLLIDFEWSEHVSCPAAGGFSSLASCFCRLKLDSQVTLWGSRHKLNGGKCGETTWE